MSSTAATGYRSVSSRTEPEVLVDLVTFAVLLAIAYRSAWLAIRIQYLIMAVIAAALVSVAIAAATGSMQYPVENVGPASAAERREPPRISAVRANPHGVMPGVGVEPTRGLGPLGF